MNRKNQINIVCYPFCKTINEMNVSKINTIVISLPKTCHHRNINRLKSILHLRIPNFAAFFGC